MQMGAAAKTSSQNNLGKKKKRFQGVKKGQNKNRPPSLFANVSRPPFPPPTIGMVRGMRRPPPFPPGRMHPGMRPIPPPGPTMRGPMPPPPLMRGPPGRIPPPPPMGMRPPPGVRPPPMMRPMPPPMIPPMGAPRPFGPSGGPVPLMGVPPRGRLGNRPGMKGKKFNKKKNSKNSSNEEVDLKKPWITDEIKSEYSKKQDLLKTARESKKKEDWDSYKEQREKCYKMFNTAKLEYIGKHPEEVHLYYGNEDDCNTEDTEHFCDTCDRGFNSADDLAEHEVQHQTCGIDGCTFNAHFKVITKHIQMQHSSGLYEKIALKNTPEDIAKWREERRKKYPTKRNIEEQEKQRGEMLKRGEKLGLDERGNRFRKENKDWKKQERKSDRKSAQLKVETASIKKMKKKFIPSIKKFPEFDIEDEKSTWNVNLPPFKGTKFLYNQDFTDPISDNKFDIDDTEWDTALPTVVNSDSTPIINNSLGSLMSAYGSDAESEDDVVNSINTEVRLCDAQKSNDDNVGTSSSQISVSNENMDVGENIPTEINLESVDSRVKNSDSDPEEKKIERVDNLPPTAFSDHNTSQNERSSRKRKRKPENRDSMKKCYKQGNKTVHNSLDRKPPRHRKLTLLERLLSNEIRHERNVILQCVNYIVKNDFFGIGKNSGNESTDVKDKDI